MQPSTNTGPPVKRPSCTVHLSRGPLHRLDRRSSPHSPNSESTGRDSRSSMWGRTGPVRAIGLREVQAPGHVQPLGQRAPGPLRVHAGGRRPRINGLPHRSSSGAGRRPTGAGRGGLRRTASRSGGHGPSGSAAGRFRRPRLRSSPGSSCGRGGRTPRAGRGPGTTQVVPRPRPARQRSLSLRPNVPNRHRAPRYDVGKTVRREKALTALQRLEGTDEGEHRAEVRPTHAAARAVPISHALCPQGRAEALGMRDSI